MKYRRWGILILMAVVFMGLRLYQIEERMNFSMDQGESMLRAYEVWQNKKIILVGPTASPVVNGRHFFHGPITYYWLMVMGVLGNWDPVRVAELITLMSLVSMGFLYKAAAEAFDEKIALTTILMWTLLPKAIDFAGLIWNPSLLLILVPPLLYTAISAIKNKKWWQFGIWGILLGWALQCHFQAGLLVIATIAIGAIKKIKLKNWMWGGVGFLIGYAPLLVFDIRNNFYNVRTIGEWLGSGGSHGLGLQQFYFLEFLPGLTILAAKYFYRWRWWLTAGIILIMIKSIFMTVRAKGMPDGWTYRDLKKTSEIVETKAGQEFNVINLLSGDTQFKPLRYLLTIRNKMPMPTNKYDKQLWIVKYNDRAMISDDKTPWELKEAVNKKIAEKWEINKKIELVELE